MPTNPMTDDLGSVLFTREPGFGRKRRRRTIPERDNSEKKPREKAVTYAEKDKVYWRITAIYGLQEEPRPRRGRHGK